MRDLLRNALHDQQVNLSANGFWAGRAIVSPPYGGGVGIRLPGGDDDEVFIRR